MAHFFHLTSAGSLDEIFHPNEFARDPAGLSPRKLFIRGSGYGSLPPIALRHASFGVLDADATEWWTHQFHDDEPLMQTVLHDITPSNFSLNRDVCLLEINTGENNDDIFVADWGVHLDPEYTGRGSENAGAIKLRYIESLVPFDDYMRGDKRHAVPEVVCFRHIPSEQITAGEPFNPYDLIRERRIAYGYDTPDAACPSP